VLKITFNPISSDKAIKQAAEAYKTIWDNDGQKIVEVVEKISGVSFSSTNLAVKVVDGPSRSRPLMLRQNYNDLGKKATLVHELCHILLRDNNLKARPFEGNLPLGIHMIIDLILFDAFADIWGEVFAKEAVRLESSRSQVYIKAWDWALGFSKEERKSKFEHFKKAHIESK
jgi:hypothetical protein